MQNIYHVYILYSFTHYEHLLKYKMFNHILYLYNQLQILID
jgi:hypothetical protein